MGPQQAAASAGVVRPHIGDRINVATRSVHARLNKAILERLPRAIPPQATNPCLYASGILHVAPIYLVFESLWRSLISDETNPPEPHPAFLTPAQVSLYPATHAHGKTTPSSEPPSCSPEVRAALAHLYLPGLARTPSLFSDLRAITGWSPSELSDQLRHAASTGRLSQLIKHTKAAVSRQPHVLLAYAWVLYMALFSGGRYLRASLEDAGPAFWSHKADPLVPGGCECCEPDGTETQTPPLSFFRFDTPEDGEDLKREFKTRLAEAEANLTGREVDDVVREAICLFDNMVLLVGQLDGLWGGDAGSAAARLPLTPREGWAAALMLPRFGKIRDSLVVARERGFRGLGGLGSGSTRGGGSSDAGAGSIGGGREDDGFPLEVEEEDNKHRFRAVHFGGETKAPEVAEGDEGSEGRKGRSMSSSFPPVMNAIVVLGIMGVIWALGQVSSE
ncbi:hypothetical protein QBC47DRAFT_226701 [Echria macrotheca]|uniref:Heme oxygenase-like protein n=1 Tax=Echria macrotheca TaxID=438768 RepID=A0AAJ0FB57_9PEZI|nr:hypothetical protein QBC47DRAFT_226701 [Echria macrotheca]